MLERFSKLAVGAGTAAAVSLGALTAAPEPADAQSQGTINTILGAAALVGGIILYNNYVHKRQAANSVVGYTANGGTVYGDGRVVMPSGQVFYPNSAGQYPWGQYAYYSPNAAPSQYQYDTQRSGRWDRTHRHDNGNHYGWERGRGNPHHGGRGHDRDRDGD